MVKKRVVLDTNVLVSAFGWEGIPHKIFESAVEGELELIVSYDQLSELRRVLEYPKFGFTENQRQRFIMIVLEVATIAEPMEKIDIVKDDPDDNIILECAVAGNAHYIVTGDRHLLGLKEFRGIRILNPREFIES